MILLAAALTLPQILELEDLRRYNPALLDSPRGILAAGRIGDPAAVPALAKRLPDDDAAFALGEIATAEAGDALAKPPLTPRMLEALGKTASAEKHGALILAELAGAKGEKARLGLIALLRAKPAGAGAAAAELLGSPETEVRRDAANVLARLKAKEGGPALRKLLSDPDPLSRANAARALAFAEGSHAAPVARLAVADPDERVRVSALRALALLKAKEQAPLLLKRMEAVSGMEALELAAALGALGDKRAVPWLKKRRGPVEVEVALARLAPDDYLKLPNPHPEALGELAPRPEAEAKLRKLLDKPEALQAWAKFNPANMDLVLEQKLLHPDFVMRATAAELMPAGKGRAALKTALEKEREPDAALAMAKALGVPPPAAPPSRFTKADYERAAARKKARATVRTKWGAFVIELLPEQAPLTVDNFVELAKKNYFDGLTFHRVVPNFVVQGGDPRGDGNGGPGWAIRCEINTVPYERGAVGMALSGKDTGGSQWFVTHSPQPHLDGGYTVFGRVVEGMDVVDRLERGDVMTSVVVAE